MIVKVKIEEFKIGDYYIMVVVVDRFNVYDVVFEFLEKKSVEYVGMNVDILKEFFLIDVEMYLVFKGNDDYVFMIFGDLFFFDIYFIDCKVFIYKMFGKKSVFLVLLEFKYDFFLWVFIKFVSDDLFKILFINYFIVKMWVFWKSCINFGFVVLMGDVDKFLLKLFGDGILVDEL